MRHGNDLINKERETDKYINIARTSDFHTSQVFGKNVCTDKEETTYGRHILPFRKNSCPKCGALIWDEEKT
jgi:hypothetical protein